MWAVKFRSFSFFIFSFANLSPNLIKSILTGIQDLFRKMTANKQLKSTMKRVRFWVKI